MRSRGANRGSNQGLRTWETFRIREPRAEGLPRAREFSDQGGAPRHRIQPRGGYTATFVKTSGVSTFYVKDKPQTEEYNIIARIIREEMRRWRLFLT